ncbi:unnamed protein product [Nippostrongylus brasiliensis]|uniref:Secreted protein n=1 Tax=Nippostrongylus brasiliensis TaxID=27835 RepID=A0A0N4YKX5_NIPBR|nr:unnamed protein product [Nippostrongylus brasiliensis]
MSSPGVALFAITTMSDAYFLVMMFVLNSRTRVWAPAAEPVHSGNSVVSFGDESYAIVCHPFIHPHIPSDGIIPVLSQMPDQPFLIDMKCRGEAPSQRERKRQDSPNRYRNRSRSRSRDRRYSRGESSAVALN